MAQSHILIVEDELIVALELEHRLRRQGYAIAGTARSAEEALAIVTESPVDLVLLDLRLAGPRDGVELARDLNERDIPFVFLTAHGDDETLARVKSVEPQGYLLKPFDERLLRLTIETSLHRHAAVRARLAAERALRASEILQATILEHSPDGVLVLTEVGSIVLSNRVAQRIFDLRGEPPPAIDELIPGLELREWMTHPGIRSVRNVEARRRDGSYFPAEVACGLAPLETGDRVIVIVRDVSARSQLEQQLARARQLEVAGRVASGVAHDLNNLLSVVWISAHMLQRSPANELSGLQADLENAISLGAALTARLLSLARHEGGEPCAVRVDEALQAITRLARRALKPGVDLVLDLDPQAACVWIDSAQLDQLVLNLMLNADRAMSEGGRLTIRSSVEDIEGAAFVVIEVEDTGVGMDESTRRRLFEPFFSTHSHAGGTGLGLSIVKDIVEQVGGTVEFESELGRGTRFRIGLPRYGDADDDASSTPEAALFGQGRVVLLVDDDESHGRSLAQLLESKGFRPLRARGAGEAMLMAERGHERLALAVIDMELPYMDGRELSERLERLHPNLPIMLISGSAISETDRRLAHAFLPKPLEPESLFGEVARLLAEPEDARCC